MFCEVMEGVGWGGCSRGGGIVLIQSRYSVFFERDLLLSPLMLVAEQEFSLVSQHMFVLCCLLGLV